MQVRAGDAPGHAHLADFLTLAHPRTALDRNTAQMIEHADEALAMVEENGFTVEEIFSSLDDGPGQWRHDRRADGRGDIDAAVRLTRLVVEETPQSEDTAHRSAHRQQASQRGQRFLGPGGKRLLDDRLFAGDAREILFRRFHHALVLEREALYGIFLGLYGKRKFTRLALTVAGRDRLRARRERKWQSNHGLPPAVARYHHDALIGKMRYRCRLGVRHQRHDRDAARHRIRVRQFLRVRDRADQQR